MDPDVAMERIKEKPPVRQIDVPDPQDPPSGCAFHPRCTKAREACAAEDPEPYDAEDTEAAPLPGPRQPRVLVESGTRGRGGLRDGGTRRGD